MRKILRILAWAGAIIIFVIITGSIVQKKTCFATKNDRIIHIPLSAAFHSLRSIIQLPLPADDTYAIPAGNGSYLLFVRMKLDYRTDYSVLKLQKRWGCLTESLQKAEILRQMSKAAEEELQRKHLLKIEWEVTPDLFTPQMILSIDLNKSHSPEKDLAEFRRRFIARVKNELYDQGLKVEYIEIRHD